MNEKAEVPKWIDRFMTRWEKRIDEPVSDSDRESTRAFFKAWAEGLSKIETEKLSDVHRRWVEWLLKKVTAEAESDGEDKAEENGPAWQERVEMELGEAYAPSVNFKALAQHRPTQSWALTFGEFVGHEFAAWNRGDPGLTAVCERFPEPWREGMKQFLESERPKRLRFVERATALAVKQPLKEAKQFFRGYSLTLQRGTFTETGQLAGETYATNIYFVMALFPEFVTELHSVRELFEWLQILLGKSQLPDISKNIKGLKRVEKICQRIDLHFGPAGRPRVTKIPPVAS